MGASLDVALVAMPWPVVQRPVAALGALAAFVRRERPRHRVRCFYAYVGLAERLGLDLYSELAVLSYAVGEQLYTPELYPRKSDDVRRHVAEQLAARIPSRAPASFAPGFGSWAEVVEHVRTELRAHLDELVGRLAGRFDVVGMTTCFAQLFANLALAARIRERSPGTVVVLGGPGVSARAGPSLLSEYPFVDHVVQGEGELPLVGLLDAVAAGEREPEVPGVVTREAGRVRLPAAPRSEVASLDTLPVPEYDEFADLADDVGLDWIVPVEGSRGCWWDRTRRTGDAWRTCLFCNANTQWSGYREKSAVRIAAEYATLSERHGNLDLHFVDNILRHSGLGDLARALGALERDFEIFVEARASVTPRDLLLLREAGLAEVQVGIDGLSTSLLDRIGKGTSVIENLQVMKVCRELGIRNHANLLIDFPGSTDAEVAETVDNVESYAVAYNPCSVSRFRLGMGSALDTLRDRLGLRNVRNADELLAGLPEDVWARLELVDLDFDRPADRADWAPVEEACARWSARHAGCTEHLLRYRDGGSFVLIDDRRGGSLRSGVFRGLARELYLYCGEIRSDEQIERRLGGRSPAARHALRDALAGFVDEKLIFEERGRYLALAAASTPRAAARRIRASAAACAAVPQRPRLRVVR